jgi:hypothetical protein
LFARAAALTGLADDTDDESLHGVVSGSRLRRWLRRVLQRQCAMPGFELRRLLH